MESKMWRRHDLVRAAAGITKDEAVLETAKLNGLDPEHCLAEIVDRLTELLPWNWNGQADKLAA
jgi:hypothetical protein